MNISRDVALERIARVLAGMELSANGHGQDRSAANAVDEAWRSHLDTAEAILNALEEPAPGEERSWAPGQGRGADGAPRGLGEDRSPPADLGQAMGTDGVPAQVSDSGPGAEPGPFSGGPSHPGHNPLD